MIVYRHATDWSTHKAAIADRDRSARRGARSAAWSSDAGGVYGGRNGIGSAIRAIDDRGFMLWQPGTWRAEAQVSWSGGDYYSLFKI